MTALTGLACATREAETVDAATLSDDDSAALQTILGAQRHILMLDDHPAWYAGRLNAVGAVLVNCCTAVGDALAVPAIETALRRSLERPTARPCWHG